MSISEREEGLVEHAAANKEAPEIPTLPEVLWRLAPTYSTCFLCRLMRGLVMVSVPLHVLDIGGDAKQVGLLASLYGIGYAVANIPAGFLLPVIGAKYTLLLACGCFLLSASICFFEDVRVLMASYFLLGLANSVGMLAQQTYISGVVHSERRGFALSIMGSLARLALALGPSMGSLLQGKLGMRAVFSVQLVCGGAAFMVAVGFLGKAAETEAHEAHEAQSRKDVMTQAKDAVQQDGGRLLRVLCLACALQCVRRGRELFFPLSGRDANLSDVLIGQVAALSFTVDMLVSPLAGQLMDSCGRRCAGFVSLMLQSLGITLLVLQTAVSIATSGALTGLGNGLSSGLLMTLGADLAPPGAGRGAFLAVYRLFFNSMEFITPALLGVLTSWVSLHASELATGAIGLLGGIWVLLCVPETLQKQPAWIAFMQAKLGLTPRSHVPCPTSL